MSELSPKDFAFLQRRWMTLWEDTLGESRFQTLTQNYSDPLRKYHTLAHILDGFLVLDQAHLSLSPFEQRIFDLAWWYHDAVYDVKCKDNEERSATLMNRECAAAKFQNEGIISTAESLILATRHATPPITFLQKVMVDVDLSILGGEKEVYRTYARAICEEYAVIVPEAPYRAGRAAFMKRFEGKPPYHLARFIGLYGERAIENVSEEIAFLNGSLPLEEFFSGNKTADIPLGPRD